MGKEHNEEPTNTDRGKNKESKDPAIWGVVGLLLVVMAFGVAVQIFSWFS